MLLTVLASSSIYRWWSSTSLGCHVIPFPYSFTHSLTPTHPSIHATELCQLHRIQSITVCETYDPHTEKASAASEKAIVTHKAPRWSPRQGKGNTKRTIDCDRRPQQNALSKKLWNNQRRRRRRHCNNNNDVKWHSRRTGHEGRRTERFLN